MKSKIILGADGATKMRQITVGIHGKGGEAGISKPLKTIWNGKYKGAVLRKASK